MRMMNEPWITRVDHRAQPAAGLRCALKRERAQPTSAQIRLQHERIMPRAQDNDVDGRLHSHSHSYSYSYLLMLVPIAVESKSMSMSKSKKSPDSAYQDGGRF